MNKFQQVIDKKTTVTSKSILILSIHIFPFGLAWKPDNSNTAQRIFPMYCLLKKLAYLFINVFCILLTERKAQSDNGLKEKKYFIRKCSKLLPFSVKVNCLVS